MPRQSTSFNQNYLQNADAFDNATWGKTNVTVDVNVDTHPLTGALTIDGLRETVVNSSHDIVQGVTTPLSYLGNNVTCSVIAKKGLRDIILLSADSGAGGVFFNLTTGVVQSSTPGYSGYISDFGGGFYRCEARKVNSIATTSWRLFLTIAAVTSYLGDNTQIAVYIGSGQVVFANWAGNVTPSFTATPIRNLALGRSTIANSQNTLGWSEDFSNALWAKQNTTITADQIANPINGAITADLLKEDATVGNYHRVYQSTNTSLKEFIPYTASVFLKDNTRRYAGIFIDTGPGGVTVVVDLQTGLITNEGSIPTNVNTKASFVQSYGNGWYRVGITFSLNVFSLGLFPSIVLSSDGTNIIYNGDNTSSVYIFGGQFVQADWMGFYTPTTNLGVLNPIRNSPSKQNYLLWSNDFTNGIWTKQAGTIVTANQTANPIDGTVDADLIDFTGAAVGTGVLQTVSFAPDLNLNPDRMNTKSIWLKGVLGGEQVTIRDPSFSVGTTTCNLTTDWQRFSLIDTGQTTNSGIWFRKSIGNQCYAYGAQLVVANWAGDTTPTTTSKITSTIRNIVS